MGWRQATFPHSCCLKSPLSSCQGSVFFVYHHSGTTVAMWQTCLQVVAFKSVCDWCIPYIAGHLIRSGYKWVDIVSLLGDVIYLLIGYQFWWEHRWILTNICSFYCLYLPFCDFPQPQRGPPQGAYWSCFRYCRCTFLYAANISAKKKQSQPMVPTFLKPCHEHLAKCERLGDC